ncbi:hypothetical protein FPZ42_10920 [Mucilaginibacter achroorhodeus]|uniref:Uncharacterized protein n=2 Tax=Mucilaginibacter achroorhodeus TaxID=2599294 RepID=A0A563U4L9_9SPHI|nr:hypothetical protein [Mucilaginibacter sp. 21P]QXV64377.1 hypothetical protein INP83_14935 [Mucilaginibacter sp. 21P]TWR26296.1 hypothetical protein FPZ42_10920 [Mucilaginibacter achroorhodeus]
MLNIWHHNLLLCFSPSQFNSFQQFTNDMSFEDRSFPFPDGSERVVLCTPNRDINFVFTREEWDDFNSAMVESLYLLEIHALLV